MNGPMVDKLRHAATDTSPGWEGGVIIYAPEAQELIALIDDAAALRAEVERLKGENDRLRITILDGVTAAGRASDRDARFWKRHPSGRWYDIHSGEEMSFARLIRDRWPLIPQPEVDALTADRDAARNQVAELERQAKLALAEDRHVERYVKQLQDERDRLRAELTQATRASCVDCGELTQHMRRTSYCLLHACPAPAGDEEGQA